MVAGIGVENNTAADDPFTSSCVAAQRPSPRHLRAKPGGGRFDDEVNTCSFPTPRFGAGSVQFSTYRRTFAVEFSKTGAASEERRKKSLRLAPGGLRGCES